MADTQKPKASRAAASPVKPKPAAPSVAAPLSVKPAVKLSAPVPKQAPVAAAPVPAAVPAAATPAPVPVVTPVKIKKEVTMNESMKPAQNGAADAIKSGATAAYTNGKAALEQVSAKSKETIEAGMKQMDDMSAMAKGNVEALMASAKAATTGLETIAHQVADFSRKSFEDTTAVARAMTTVKTPNEFMQLQNDFAKAQFDAAVAEMSKLSETLVKLAGEVFEPMQNRIATATDKMKSVVGTTFKA